MQPELSIIIPAYNVENYIEEAVRSALAQRNVTIEAIVVDDGSTDGTQARVAAIADPRIVLVHQQNKGLAGARNSGIQKARGRYIGFLDGDDAWLPDFSERLLAVLKADTTIGGAYSQYRYIDEASHPTGYVLGSPYAEPTLAQMARRNHAASHVILRRECLAAAGIFDEQLRSCEDWELSVRILANTRYRLRMVPEPLALYRERRGSLSNNFDHFLRNADLAVERIRQRCRGVPERALRRGHAECYRIASRKALAAGNLPMARRHILSACRKFPLLPLVDWRAAATATAIVCGSILPRHCQELPYHMLRRLASSRRGSSSSLPTGIRV
jgi:glycosyltransferase involved in cell wall biosynthesis